MRRPSASISTFDASLTLTEYPIFKPGIKHDPSADFLVPITQSTVELIVDHHTWLDPGRGDLIFSNAIGGPLYSVYYSDWNAATEALGVGHLTSHDPQGTLIDDIERIAGLVVAWDLVKHQVQTQTGRYTRVTPIEELGQLWRRERRSLIRSSMAVR